MLWVNLQLLQLLKNLMAALKTAVRVKESRKKFLFQSSIKRSYRLTLSGV